MKIFNYGAYGLYGWRNVMVIKRIKREDTTAAKENRRNQQIRSEQYQLSLETVGTVRSEMTRKGLVML